MSLRPITPVDRAWIIATLEAHWGSSHIASRGKLWDAAALPGFIVERQAGDATQSLGLATYRVEGDECELVTLDALQNGIGIGTALLEAVHEAAREAGSRRVWLITTNDNTSALRFYQKRGYRLAALHVNAMENSRRLKPSIPLVGIDGIPIRDEVELEFLLG